MNVEHPSYLKALTFPRFLLASIVVIFHFGLHLNEIQNLFLAPFLNHGAVCVSFFFFLSGVVLSYNYKGKVNNKTFWLKRIFRIYPLYFLTFILVFSYQFFVSHQAPTPVFGLVNLFGLQSWAVGHAMEVNFPSWSISVEFFFYLIFPFLLWLMKKLNYKKFMLLGFIFVVLGWFQHFTFVNFLWEPNRFYLEQFILYFPLFHVTTFLAGMMCGLSIERLRKLGIHPLMYSVLSAIGIVLFVWIMNTTSFLRPYAHNGGLIPVFTLICLGLSLDKTFFYRIFGWKPLVYLGEISYGVYMWQFPIYIAFGWLINKELLELNEFIIYFLSLILVSIASFEFIEKPLKKQLSKRFIGHRQL